MDFNKLPQVSLQIESSTELPEGFSVVEMVESDIGSYVEHKRICWLETYPSEVYGISQDDVRNRLDRKEPRKQIQDFKEFIKNNKTKIYLLKKDDKIVGDVIYTIGDEKAEINEIYLRDEVKGKKLGKFLMGLALSEIPKDKDVYLAVLEINETAIQFYQRFGFWKVEHEMDKKSVKFGEKEFAEIYMVLKAKKLKI